MKSLTATSIAALASIFIVSAPAQAADVYQGERTTPADAYAGPVISWTGVVVGGSVGYGAANYELDFPGVNFDGISGRGFSGCGIIGAQQQVGVFVFGAEGRGCLSDITTELNTIAGDASLTLDNSYSVYGKGGIAHGTVLTSLLLGARWQHYEASGFGGSADDTVFGISGGILFEKKIDDAGRWNVGLDGLFTQFDEQEAAILNIDPTLLETNLRLTYTFGR